MNDFTPNMYQYGLAVGRTIKERRLELAYTLMELSHFICPFWNRGPDSTRDILSSIDSGGGTGQEVFLDNRYRSTIKPVTIQRQLSDYMGALDMPPERKAVIQEVLRVINPAFALEESRVPPYSVHREKRKYSSKKGQRRIQSPIHFLQLEGVVERMAREKEWLRSVGEAK